MRSLQTIAVLAVAFMLLPVASSVAGDSPRRPAARMQTQNNLKQIGVASHAAKMQCQNNLKQLGLAAEAAAVECSNKLKQLHAQPQATRRDLARLKRLRTKPSVLCGEIQFVYQCISGQTMFLQSAGCRRGETEASCCQRARTSVNKKCGRIWALAKKSGKIWSPGIFTCKCTQPAALKRESR